MTTNTDPQPAATEAAIRETVETIINESVWHEYGGDEDDELFIGAIVRERIELAGITFVATPPSGQVCVDREALKHAMYPWVMASVDLDKATDEIIAALKGADR